MTFQLPSFIRLNVRAVGVIVRVLLMNFNVAFSLSCPPSLLTNHCAIDLHMVAFTNYITISFIIGHPGHHDHSMMIPAPAKIQGQYHITMAGSPG